VKSFIRVLLFMVLNNFVSIYVIDFHIILSFINYGINVLKFLAFMGNRVIINEVLIVFLYFII